MWSCAPSQEPHIDDCCPLAAVIMDTQLNRPPHKMHTLLMSRQKYQYYASTRQVLMKDRGNFSHARGPRYATAIVGLLGLLNTNMKKCSLKTGSTLQLLFSSVAFISMFDTCDPAAASISILNLHRDRCITDPPITSGASVPPYFGASKPGSTRHRDRIGPL